MLASDIYAKANSLKNEGTFECHWCGAKCTNMHKADYIPRQSQLIYRRLNNLERRPASAYECWGCWLWKRKRTTIDFLAGGFLDGKWIANYSVLITEHTVKVVRPPHDIPQLYEFLFKPPLRFALSLLSNGPILSGILPKNGELNYLQCCVCNDLPEIRDNTKIYYTLNSIEHFYTIADLENGAAEPGTQALIGVLGPVPEQFRAKPDPELLKGGRPTMVPKNLPGRRIVVSSGEHLATV